MTTRPTAAGVTFTTRGIALAVHCLRRSRFVRNLEPARTWLATRDVETDLIRLLPGHERRLLPMLRLPPIRAGFLAAIDLRVPGTTRHLLARKLWFHREAWEFLGANEPRQVVILGAGLDGLGIRLATRYPHATIVEVDRAAPMELKQDLIGATGRPHFLACDLATGSRFDHLDPGCKTLILAEGILMYLPPARVGELLSECAGSLHGPIRLAFSYVEVGAAADRTSPVARLGRALARRGDPEPFRWCPAATAIPGFLDDVGFAVEETFGSLELTARTLGPDPGIPNYGEFLATARRSSGSGR